MNAQLAPSSEHPQHAQALLRTLVITDLCDSTALVERLGDQRTAELIREHDRLLRGLIRRHRGQEVDKTDGFLSLFERPIQAVAFALDYQRDLQAFAREHGVALKARIGIHVGEVMTWQNNSDDVADGAKPMEVEGLAKPIAARLMGLALPGQILLSSVAYTLAHRAEGELGATLSRLKWKHHGRFRFKGVAEAVPVYEIGEPDIAPFRSPAWTGKAHREVPLWRRPVSLALEGMLLLALVALPLWHFLKPEPAIAFAERDWVVLGDLRNLTGDARFDDSLEQAFRIGLEQSRHVNVVSDLRLQQALEMMRKDPSGPLDRAVGAELAAREGARALILPTLAEVGGRLRLSLEVIEPASQSTVHAFAMTADSASGLIESVDEGVVGLMQFLQQPLEEENAPPRISLVKATTGNLEALRAYSLGMRALVSGSHSEAEALLDAAIELDSDFALARLGLASSYRARGDRTGALDQIDKALAREDRLSARERFLARATRHLLRGEGGQATSSWKVAADLYPDSYAAQGGLAWSLWMFEARPADALARALASAADQNPLRAAGVNLTATLKLATEDYEGAREWFRESARLRPSVPSPYAFAVDAAERRFEDVHIALSGSGMSGSDGTRQPL
ncbi:putative peptide modification system cyclase [Aquimonas sp.]|jgi:putative peptide modification system cyclase|uniref:putative peptide modification system cyclase n=1 Tax=Aquimonas sp. TaxID=1872588 RepID=UPI0037C13D73